MKTFVNFLHLALFCDKALTGETLHSVQFLFSLICYALFFVTAFLSREYIQYIRKVMIRTGLLLLDQYSSPAGKLLLFSFTGIKQNCLKLVL